MSTLVPDWSSFVLGLAVGVVAAVWIVAVAS
jgi:hypothetical protein